jgi:hypothetical protein
VTGSDWGKVSLSYAAMFRLCSGMDIVFPSIPSATSALVGSGHLRPGAKGIFSSPGPCNTRSMSRIKPAGFLNGGVR